MARKKQLKKLKKTVDEKISEALDVDHVTKDLTKPHKPQKPQSAGDALEPVEGEVIDTAIVVREEQPLALGYAMPGENPEIDEDYKVARKILDDTGKQATQALDQMKEVAEQGQTAREYEVVGQLIKANLEVVKAKTDLHKDMKSLREPDGKGSPRVAHIGDVNNSVFVGTTQDLLKLNKAGKLPKQDESK